MKKNTKNTFISIDILINSYLNNKDKNDINSKLLISTLSSLSPINKKLLNLILKYIDESSKNYTYSGEISLPLDLAFETLNLSLKTDISIFKNYLIDLFNIECFDDNTWFKVITKFQISLDYNLLIITIGSVLRDEINKVYK